MRLPVVTVMVLAAFALSGCLDPPDKRPEADALRSDVAGMPGVDAAELHYEKGVALDPADVDLRVRMADDATTEQVAQVFVAAYDGFLDEHAEEEGNLEVRWHDDTLELRSFEPRADADDVRAAALAAAGLVGRGRLLAQVTTQDVETEPHVRTSMWLWLAPGADREALRSERRALRAAFDDLLLGHVDTRLPRRSR